MQNTENIIKDVNQITDEEGYYLLSLAEKAIHDYVTEHKVYEPEEIKYENAKKLGASFVTLEKKGQLRGCIGSIIPYRPLYKDVIENAIAAATKDPRFPPVTPEELKDIDVKLSILSYPERIIYRDYKDLLEKIEPFKDGLIIKYGNHQATFLPDVWHQIPDKELFLSNLCYKAGLPPDFWKTGLLEVYRYRTKTFSKTKIR
ncbi:MAG: AmmeMemoRadiSam system protein A [Aquificae bacterium]|nr:AmmeMemoRadiSam system protein A [Aquificota bacterium]